MACKGVFEPAKMPPTDCSAYYHGLKVHLQIFTWKLLEGDSDGHTLNPEEWGWRQTIS